MDDVGEPFNEPPADDTGILSQASRRELLDLSDCVVRSPTADAARHLADAKAPQPVAQPQTHDDFDDVEPELRIGEEDEDNLHVVLAMNEAMSELVDNMLEKANAALKANIEKQRVLAERKKIVTSNAALVKRKVPVNMFMPPYFKDRFNMCPPQNGEMKRKLECMIYDPLLKEEKKWTAADLRTLNRAVRTCMIEDKLTPIYAQRDLLYDKIRAADATTTEAERADWNVRLDALNRRIDFEKNLADKDVLTGDYSEVDWATIAMVHFKGHRTPSSIRLKWCNEQCPQWSKADWTSQEVKKLSELASTGFVSWTLIADQLGTRRTPWQCFEKYKSEISSEILKREWTQEEDDRLIKLVESLQLNGVIQWDKVTYHMAGRTRQQCRTRFLRTLDKTIKHGRWTDEEDLLLMCSIGRYGAKDWRKIAKGVPGRSDGQCRERWVNVLDRANRAQEWTMEEDEKLLYAVNMFGKGQWAKISTVLPGRSGPTCKSRFRSLLTTKMRICAAQLTKIRSAQRFKGYRSHHHKRREENFAEFNRLLGGDDETGDAFCRRAREASSMTFNPRVKTVDPEVLRVVEEGMQGIAQKYNMTNGQQDLSGDLFDEIVEGQALRKEQQWLPVDFEPEVMEDEKCQRMTEAICQLIGKQDQLITAHVQENNSTRVELAVIEKMRELLEEVVTGRVEAAAAAAARSNPEDDGPSTSKAGASRALQARLRAEMQQKHAAVGGRDLLRPTAATAHAAELLLSELPRIAQIATPLLTGLWSGERLKSMEQIEQRLTEALNNHKEYTTLKELFRSLLIEPLMLIYSIEDDDKKQRALVDDFNRLKNSLMGDVEETKDPKPAAKRARKSTAGGGGGRGIKKAATPRKSVEREGGKTKTDAAALVDNVLVGDDEDDDDLSVDWDRDEEEPASALKTPKRAPSAAAAAKKSGAKATPNDANAAPASAKKRGRPDKPKTPEAAEPAPQEDAGVAPEEAEVAPASTKKKGRQAKPKTPKAATPKDDGAEEAPEDAEAATPATASKKRGRQAKPKDPSKPAGKRGRPRKSKTPEFVESEPEEDAEAAPAGAEVAPGDADVAPEDIEAAPKDAEKTPEDAEMAPEGADVAPTAARKRGRSEEGEEKITEDEEETENPAKRAKKSPTPAAEAPSEDTVPVEEGQETTEPVEPEDTVSTEAEDTVATEGEDAVAAEGEEDTVAADGEDTVAVEVATTVSGDAGDTVPEESADTVDNEDTVEEPLADVPQVDAESAE